MGRRVSDTPRRFPDPGALALLGEVLWLTVRDGDVVRRFRWLEDPEVTWGPAPGAPGLLWSPSCRALVFVDGMEHKDWKRTIPRGGPVHRDQRLDMREMDGTVAGADPKDVRAAAKIVAEWHGRPPTKYRMADFEPVPLRKLGEGFDILYRSDKFNGEDGEEAEHIHHFAKSGSVKVSGGPDKDHPGAFFIKGGRLTVNDRGIIY